MSRWKVIKVIKEEEGMGGEGGRVRVENRGLHIINTCYIFSQ
jgi:hypothetical protein